MWRYRDGVPMPWCRLQCCRMAFNARTSTLRFRLQMPSSSQKHTHADTTGAMLKHCRANWYTCWRTCCSLTHTPTHEQSIITSCDPPPPDSLLLTAAWCHYSRSVAGSGRWQRRKMVDRDEGNTGSRDSLPEQICSPGVGWRSEEVLTILLRRQKMFQNLWS